jgi:8-oxo-dGTP diphosphatase
VLILLVRHGHAGSRAAWKGDDRLRPLNQRGWAEATGLVDRLAPFEPVRIMSSPLVRCRQTVEPLATKLGLPLEESDRLAPEASKRVAAFLRQQAEKAGPIVLCTHGEVIEVIQAGFSKHVGGRKRPSVRAKGSTWVLEYTKGRIATARYLPAPRP